MEHYLEVERVIDRKIELLSGCLDIDDGFQIEAGGDEIDKAVSDAIHRDVIQKKERDSILFRALIEAKRKIRTNSYGICETCGDNIELTRLMALPTAANCVICQETIEREKKL